MVKIRVHELAKEFGLASKEMEARIKDLGYSIKNYMSTLEDYEAEEIRKKLRGREEFEAGKSRKTVVRRRHQVIRLKKVTRPEPELPEEEIKAAAQRAAEKAGAGIAPEAKPAEVEERAPERAVEKPVEAVESAKPEEPAKAEREEEVVAKPETEAVSAGAAKKEKAEKTRPKPEPKRFVKILERRIEIPEPAAAPSGPAEPSRPARTKRGKRPESVDIVPEIAAAPEKKGKKKGKRIVQGDELGGKMRKRKAMPKRKERQKPLNKLFVDEFGAELTRGQMKGVSAQKPGPAPGTAPPKAGKRKFAIYETIQVSELAKRMGIKIGDVIMKLMSLGTMATANQSIDFEAAELIASEFGYEVEKKAVAEDMVHLAEEAEGGVLKPRPPVVTVMGHVDHGKTSLLDAIRKADVVSSEAGGITQHIGAHHVTLPDKREVVFLDTPGHEAFTSMRARGAKVTDIVILVVAADDGVMAQTREAIDHSKAAGVPIIVAVNKIDKPGANPDRVMGELAELGLVPEAWGGDTIFVKTSAKEKTGIEELLELLALQAEVMELKADPDRPARGHVIEARLDKGRGPVATLLVTEGTLHIGDALVCGIHFGRIRAMINDKGERVTSAGPSIPVEVQGLSGVPEAGNEFTVLPDEKKAREVSDYRQRKAREKELVATSKVSLESVFEKIKEKELKELNIVLKTDVQGSMEALSDALVKLSTSEIRVNIVHSGIGAISESDVLLASASNAIVIGFNVRTGPQVKALAEQEHVDMRFYDVIYHALDEVRSAMTGLLEPVYVEKVLGHVEVRETYHIPKVGTVAGCYVLDGTAQRNAMARLLRDNVVVYTGRIASLRRFKEDVKEVTAGYECGLGLERFNDIKIGDIVETYEMEEVAAVLGTPESEQESAQGKGS